MGSAKRLLPGFLVAHQKLRERKDQSSLINYLKQNERILNKKKTFLAVFAVAPN